MIAFSRPAMDLIKTRRSWRSYLEEPIETAHREHISNFLNHLDTPPFDSRVRLLLVDSPQKAFGKVLGTYGVVTGASSFLIGALKHSHRCYIDYGYLFEAAILEITSLGLGTCWMGGTLSRSFFADMARLQPGETIPTISPVGFIAEKRNLIDAMFVLGAGSRSRKPWDTLFFDCTFEKPLNPKDAGPFELPLKMVRLAPSASNRQPWRVVMDDKGLHFFLARTLGYKLMFKDVDLQGIDMGIAMLHFEQSVREQGLTGLWKVLNPSISSLPGRSEYVVSWMT